MKRRFGLIGYPLSHSFSKEYFDHKFRNEKITDSEYENYELKEIREFRHWLEIHTEILGLNVTIPYKESVMTYLDQLDPGAKRIGAVNVIKKMPDGHLKGYNSDYYGFRTSLERWLGKNFVNTGVLVLGGGGAAKAVIAVLEDCNLEFLKVSRTNSRAASTAARKGGLPR